MEWAYNSEEDNKEVTAKDLLRFPKTEGITLET